MALLALAGCGVSPSGPGYSAVQSSIPPLAPGSGRVFFYHQSQHVGSAATPSIVLNEELVGQVPAGGFFYVDRPPGNYHVTEIIGFGVPNAEMGFSLQAGETLYIRQYFALTGGNHIEVVPASLGQEEIRATQLSSLSRAPILGEISPVAATVRPAALAKPASEIQKITRTESVPTIATPDEAEKILERRISAPGKGLYALDDQISFNVLDSVYYDPAEDVLSLIGHFDSRYRGNKIPYLQHLAVLLRNPRPEFSLNWTPDSQRRVDAFFNQQVIERMSANEADSLMAKWGQIVDAEKNLTHSGQLLVSAMGLTPIEGARAPGAAGVEVSLMPGDVTLRVTRVVPDSAADRAGLRPGDIIVTIRGRSPLTPFEFARRVRLSGEGQPINLTYRRPSAGSQVISTRMTPTASPGKDPWNSSSSYDLLQVLYNTSGDFKAANVINLAGMMDRSRRYGSDEIKTELRGLLINALELRGAVNADMKAIDQGSMTELAAFRDIYLKICQGLDETFHFPGGPVARAYLAAYRGGDPSNAIPPAMDEFDRQMLPKVKELLNLVFARPEGLQIPPELVEEQFHVHPEMLPQYLGLPGDTLLAQVMFDSDYLCKRLMNRPDLKQRIPRYQTGFEFEVKNPQFRHSTGMYRIWISVDKQNTPQSPAGTTLALRDVTMRFNIREEDTKDVPNRPGSYEELLTSLWNDFEVEYPTLHELRETAKLAAAARWMLMRNPAAALPGEGRVQWQGPTKVPGLMFMELAPDPQKGMNKTHVTTIAEGGVSEAPPVNFVGEPFPSDTSVVDLRGSSFFSPPAGQHIYTATAAAQPGANAGAVASIAGWVTPVDKGGTPGNAVVVTSVFGSKVVKANLADTTPRAPGSNTHAGAQLLSAAATATSDQPENLTRNFDIGGAPTARSLDYPKSTGTVTAGGALDPATFSDRVKNDPQMISALQRLSELQTKREQLNADRDRLTLQRNQEKDPEKMKQLTAELGQKDAEYQGNLVALAEQKETVAKVKRTIDDKVAPLPSDTSATSPTTPPAAAEPKP